MPTQKPLQDMIPDILNHIRVKTNTLNEHKKLYELYDKQLMKHLNEALFAESVKPETRAELIKRAAALNFLPKIINKKSLVYDVSPSRTLESNEEPFNNLIEELALDVKLQEAAELVQLNGCVAIEPFLSSSNKPKLRVIPAHQFLMYSDDPKDPTEPTVFIKFMGTKFVEQQDTDVNGISRRDDETHVQEVALYHLYSADEFLIITSQGQVDFEEMDALEADGTNPLGTLPVIYINRSKNDILPNADTTKIQQTLLIPLMYTDLNYATKYQSHSLIAVSGAEPTNAPATPDSIWYLAPEITEDGQALTPNIEIVQPNVDSDKANALILQQVALWLDLEGVKTGSIGNLEGQNVASGVSKLIDEADSSEEISKLKKVFLQTEDALYTLLTRLHNDFWRSAQNYPVSGVLAEGIKPAVEFGVKQVVQNTKIIAEEQALLLNNKLTSKRRALKKVHPNLSDREIDELIQEIDEDSQKAFDKMLSNMESNNATGSNDDENSELDNPANGVNQSNPL